MRFGTATPRSGNSICWSSRVLRSTPSIRPCRPPRARPPARPKVSSSRSPSTASTVWSPAFGVMKRPPVPRSACSPRAAPKACGMCAISRPNSGTTSTLHRRRAHICACIRSCIGPKATSGPIPSAKAFPSSRSIWRATATATARSVMWTLRFRSNRTPGPSMRSSLSLRQPGFRNVPAAPWTTNPRTPSNVCAKPATCDRGAHASSDHRKETAMNVQISRPLNSVSPAAARALVRIVIVGHVDHGKSTLIGRLLHETDGLPDGKLDALKAVSTRRGMPFEWSFLLDALQTERDQGITIDTSQIRLHTAARDIVLIDAPGHAEFLRNMITGAAQADAAVLMVDATEGVRDQTRRHGYLLHILGVRHVMVGINKMDRVGFNAGKFTEIESEIAAHLAGWGLAPAAIIPIAPRNAAAAA